MTSCTPPDPRIRGARARTTEEILRRTNPEHYRCAIGPIVEDNPDLSRFELRVDGELVGWSEYRPAGDSVIVAHTEIDERREGEGLGGVLVRGTLDQIRASGKAVIPTCPFTAAYIRRHPEYTDLVDASLRGQFAPPP